MDRELYLLLLLSDSNLPTGSFVASAGLESSLSHGFTGPDAIATFVRDSLSTYAPSALPFVADAHAAVLQLASAGQESTIALLKQLDDLYECMTLNHVARRASKAQGVALLSLYSKGFSRPPGATPATDTDDERSSKLVDAFKLMVRRGGAHGHLPICWGILCAALGLSLERTQHLHLYLHARSLLSAAVRLNSIGPYAAQQIILHVVPTLVDESIQKCAHLRTGELKNENEQNDDAWDDTRNGPANTWPLGEILAARHDLQHSRIFNS